MVKESLCTLRENNYLTPSLSPWELFFLSPTSVSKAIINKPLRLLPLGLSFGRKSAPISTGTKVLRTQGNYFPLRRDGTRLSPAERRRSPRMKLQIPLFIRGVDISGSLFLDLTKSLDISANGALLAAPRQLSPDSSLQITIPVPSLTTSAYTTIPPETPPIQARVRRHSNGGDLHFIAVEFLEPLV